MINNFTGMMGRFESADWYLARYKTSRGYRFTNVSEQSVTPEESIRWPGFKADIADYVWNLKENQEDETSNRVLANMTNTWQIIDPLSFRVRIGTDFTSSRIETRNRTQQPLAFRRSGSFGMKSYLGSIAYGDALLTFTKNIISDLELNVMGGYTATKQLDQTQVVSTNDGLSVENWFDIKASNLPPTTDLIRTNLVRDAFLGTVNLNYKGYLFAEGTVRRERISVVHPSRNTLVYPSANASFVFSDAIQLPTFFSYGKVRASWGIVGNYPDVYGANIAYTQNTLGIQTTGGQPVIYTTLPTAFGNDNILPEQKHEVEFGVETKFLNNRLSLDITYYNGQIRDQILPLTVAQSTGASSILTNIGILRNKGLEVGISATPVKTKDFQWETSLNFSQNKNTIEQLTTGSRELIHADYDGNAAVLKSVIGQPMGDFYIHPIAKNEKGENIIQGDGLYQLDDTLVKVGNAMPQAVGGFINTFQYKNFSLDVVVDFRIGGHVMPTGINWMISRGLLEESLNYMNTERGGLSYYVDADGKGVQTSAAAGPNGEQVFHDGMLMPGATIDGAANTNVMSQAYYYWNTYNWGGPQYGSSRYELYVKKNTYAKLREVALSYRIPGKVAEKIGAKNLSISVFGRNLFYFYRTLKNLDAEATVAGSRWFQSVSNAGTNPSTRTVGIMLRTNF